MRERDLEKMLCRRVTELKGVAYKFVSPGKVGVPDRLCVFPYNLFYFVEVKAPGKKLTSLQQRRANDLARLGCNVHMIDSPQALDLWLDNVRKRLP